MRTWIVATVLGALAAPTMAQEARTVPVYDSTQIALDRYVVVKRMGVHDWKSMFFIPSYGDLTSATNALLAEAARLGADGIVNLHCLSQSDRSRRDSYYCYGNAIKLKK